jgi:hypothetical protein
MKISLLILLGLTMAFMVQTGEGGGGKVTCTSKLIAKSRVGGSEYSQKCKCTTKFGDPKCTAPGREE